MHIVSGTEQAVGALRVSILPTEWIITGNEIGSMGTGSKLLTRGLAL